MTIKEFKIQLLPLKNRLFRLSFSMMKNRDDAEDAVQEVYTRIWKMQGKVDSIKNIEAFMLTMTRNYCLDMLKSKKNRFLSLNEDIVKQSESTPYESAEQMDLVENVKRIIKHLPEQQRTVIHLRDIEGYNYEEIIKITGWDINYLRVNLSRGRKKIKEIINKIQHYEPAKY
jgi:RNA polymerase sigma-70 factor, ECF subfamily